MRKPMIEIRVGLTRSFVDSPPPLETIADTANRCIRRLLMNPCEPQVVRATNLSNNFAFSHTVLALKRDFYPLFRIVFNTNIGKIIRDIILYIKIFT